MSRTFKHPLIYLKQMIDHAIKARTYSQETNFEIFCKQKQDFDAICLQLSQIGEQVSKLDECPEKIIEKFAEYVPWIELRGLRNRIDHNYSSINAEMIWDFAINDLDDLILGLQRIIKKRFGEKYPI